MVPRFLEAMPIAEGATLVKEHLVTAAEMKRRLRELLVDQDGTAEEDKGLARYVRARHDPGLRVGFITGSDARPCPAHHAANESQSWRYARRVAGARESAA